MSTKEIVTILIEIEEDIETSDIGSEGGIRRKILVNDLVNLLPQYRIETREVEKCTYWFGKEIKSICNVDFVIDENGDEVTSLDTILNTAHDYIKKLYTRV